MRVFILNDINVCQANKAKWGRDLLYWAICRPFPAPILRKMGAGFFVLIFTSPLLTFIIAK